MRTDLGWRLDPGVTFLNHGSFGACPEPVLAVQRELRDRLERHPVAFMDRDLPDLLEAARRRLGDFLRADPDGLGFVTNATTGVNAVIRSMRFAPGDEILTDDHEYNAILTTLQEAARRDRATVVIARLPFPDPDPDTVIDAILSRVGPRTRLAVISHVTSPTALVLPIERIVRELDQRGVDALVDGAHAPGMLSLDLDGLGAAYYAGNGHKWLCGPKGSAFLWVRADRRDRVRPTVISHGANDPRTDRTRFRMEFDWPGTVDPTAVLSLPAAIDWMAAQEPGGWPADMKENHDRAVVARDTLARALGIEPPAPDAMLGSMAAMPLTGVKTDDAA
jgi:isopenicillin-N epimerase